MKEFQFFDIYSLVSLIDQSVHFQEGFWNYDEDYFITASTRCSMRTLLHHYIVTRALNYYHREFRKNGDLIDKDIAENWKLLFETYKIELSPLDIENEEDPLTWMEENQDLFVVLLGQMSDEALHILFQNRNFLIKFNELVSETVQEIEYPGNLLTKKGTLKRSAIPKWAKNAVYHRDKGRCVYCNTDLTGLVNTMTARNFDHIRPLDLYGTNDPCNLQLTCETCNKRKSNKEASTSFTYQPWW